MDSTTVTPADKKVAMPATSSETIPIAKDTEEINITSQPRTRAYPQALPVVDVIGLAKSLGLYSLADKNTADTAKDSDLLETDNKHITKLVDIDVPACSPDEKTLASDTKPVSSQQKDATITPHDRSAEEISANTALSTRPTNSTNSSSNNDPELEHATVEGTAPVPHVYPPRRPNIFKKRGMKRAARPVYVWSHDSAAQTVANTAERIQDDGGEEFTAEGFEEFQSAQEEHMSKKTEGFLRMVSQHSWRPRVVEDLGEAFALED